MRMTIVLAAILLGGCRGSIEFGRFKQEIVAPPGTTVIENNNAEVIEPPAPAPAPDCQARARFFRGTVAIPCADIGRTVAP